MDRSIHSWTDQSIDQKRRVGGSIDDQGYNDVEEDDQEDEGAFGRGNRGGKASSTATPGMSRKQKRREIKREKKMNKKRRFEMQARKQELNLVKPSLDVLCSWD